MADGISFTFDTHEFTEMTDGMIEANKKATMYAMRATGRYLARTAKARAPVYKGTDPRAMAESGNLKKSITNAKKLVQSADSYSLKVGPFGTKKKGTDIVRHGTRNGHAIDSRTAAHLGIKGPSRKAGESSKGQVRGVPLYRSKMEAKYGYMAAGIAAADAGAKEIYEAAYEKAWAKWMSK